MKKTINITRHSSRLTDDIAIFAIGDETRTVDIREIYTRWVADYTLFWKAPHQYKTKLDPGSRGPLVTWLDQQLSVVQGRAVRPDDKQVFDNMMIKEIREFQMTAGLVPDGIVGARTLICLANADGHWWTDSQRENRGPIKHVLHS